MVQGVVLEGRRVRLRPLGTPDYAWLYETGVGGEVAPRWRFRGTTPSPDDFVRALWDGVLVQFVVEHGGSPVGMVTCYGADFRSGHAYFAIVAHPRASGTGLVIEGTVLFVDYLFDVFPFRKLYAEVLSVNLPAFASAVGRYLVEEGRLREHERYGEGYCDLHTFAVYRDHWREAGRRLRAYVRRP